MMTTLLTLADVAACLAILFNAEPALNRMRCHTRLCVRVAMYLLVVGASGELWTILVGHQPDWPTVVSFAGIAALLATRRLRRAGQDHSIIHL